MKAAEALALVERVRAWVRSAPAFTDRAADERAALLSSLASLEVALTHPTSLCTRDQLFDAVLCDEPDAETGESPLLVELLDQIDPGAHVAYLAARQAREEAERRARLHRGDAHCLDSAVPDPAEAP